MKSRQILIPKSALKTPNVRKSKMGIRNCACPHCGKTHKMIEVLQLSKPDGEWTLYFDCPDTGKRELLAVVKEVTE